MQVMVLGAGRGTRLAGLGLGVPKILVPINGEPLLSRQLRYLAGEGARRVVVNAHHLAGQVERFAVAHRPPPELVVVCEPELLGTAGGVRNALAHFGPEPIVVLYGDVLTDARLERLLAAHADAGAQATLAVYESEDTRDKGTVTVDREDRVTRFVEKADGQPGPALINAGIYAVQPAFMAGAVQAGAFADFGRDVFPAALDAGDLLRVHRLEMPVLDIGTPASLRRA